jgi:predicted RNA methylase
VLRKNDVTEDDVFIDLGSGKGRVVIQAAQYPIRKVIGVELSEELHQIARQNVERSRGTVTCANIELVRSDVLAYDIPDDVTIAYFFNPFQGEVFGLVVEKLVASLRRRPRVLKIIYMNPVEEDRLIRAGAKLLKSVDGFRPTKAWARLSAIRLYTLSPPTGTSEADATSS